MCAYPVLRLIMCIYARVYACKSSARRQVAFYRETHTEGSDETEVRQVFTSFSLSVKNSKLEYAPL